jgi:hypothetical protein
MSGRFFRAPFVLAILTAETWIVTAWRAVAAHYDGIRPITRGPRWSGPRWTASAHEYRTS